MKLSRIVLAVLLTAATAGCSSLTGSTVERAQTTDAAPTTEPTVPATTVTTVPPTLPPAVPSGLCDSYEDPVTAGTIENDEATEISGIVSSRRFPEVLWMLNDSGGGPFLYASSTSGEYLGTFELDTSTFDWEDIAIASGRGSDYLYLGDIGDNLHFRPYVTVHRIAEPTPVPAGGFIDDVEEFNLTYPDPGPDAEAMLVDPVTGDLIIVTKPASGGEAAIFRAPAAKLVDGATIELEQIATFPLDKGVWVTGADTDTTGAAIIFRGYNEVWVWRRTQLDLSETFATEPCRAPSTAEVQGESITFAADGLSYYTVSEGKAPDINYVFSVFD